MKVRLLPLVALSLACAVAVAQDAPTAPRGGPGGRGGFGGGGMGMGMGLGGGVQGTITEVAADHYKIKSEAGETYIVHFSANTRFFKQPAGMRGAPGQGRGGGMGPGGAPPADAGARGPAGGGGMGGGMGVGRPGGATQAIKPTDIKAGDAVAAMGEIDAKEKSIGAVMIMQLDPERARQMAEMQANYGKTWLMGKVTAIDGVKVTVAGSLDSKPRSFVADENTTLRKRRDPITLADIQIGDTVRAEGAIKDGVFTATTISVTGAPISGAPGAMPPSPPPQ